MAAESISDVVEQAVGWTGMKNVPVEDRSRLVTDNGPGFLAHAFEDYLRMLALRHIRCSPHHPQTNGKLEHFHETLKSRVNLLVYSSPEELRRSIAEFIEFYNHRRHHEEIGNVAPADVYYGRRDGILKRREEQKRVTLEKRFRYNRSRSKETTTGALARNRSYQMRLLTLIGAEEEHLATRGSGAVNGVSRLHGQVSRRIFSCCSRDGWRSRSR